MNAVRCLAGRAFERFANPTRNLPGENLLIGRSRFFRFVGRFHVALQGLVKGIRRSPFLAALVIQTEVNEDPVKPGIKARSPVKFFEIRKSFQKRLLRQVLGVFAVARKIKGDVIGLLFMAFHEFLERTAVALLGRATNSSSPGFTKRLLAFDIAGAPEKIEKGARAARVDTAGSFGVTLAPR